MSLYLSEHELAFIEGIDADEVQSRVTQALDDFRPASLRDLNLSAGGAYIAGELRKFQRDLAEHAGAKAAAKRERTRSRAWRSGDDLVFAIHRMQDRAREEREETKYSRVEEAVTPPYRLGERIEVRINYRWRRSIKDPWSHGAIVYGHNVDLTPDYTLPQPKRRPSSAKLEEQRQERLYREWDDLRRRGSGAVREYLRSGGDAAGIPERFEAKLGRHDRYLDNFSCDFWPEEHDPRNRRAAIAQLRTQETPSDDATPDGSLSLDVRVWHAKFGEGVVIHIAGEHVTATFGDGVAKRVMAGFLKPVQNERSS